MEADKNKFGFTITIKRFVNGCSDCPMKESLGGHHYCSAFEFPGKTLHSDYSHEEGRIPEFCPKPKTIGQKRVKL